MSREVLLMQVNGADLQFVIHKNDEAGMKQNQHVQRPMVEQAMIGHDSERALHKSRTQTTKTQSATGRKIKGDQDDKHQGDREQKGKQNPKHGQTEQERTSESSIHPYKGRHIDFTL